MKKEGCSERRAETATVLGRVVAESPVPTRVRAVTVVAAVAPVAVALAVAVAAGACVGS